ncbi:hypothetical protein Vadar_021818 [Vaccinium darrowii]|uniref:Uncharacterized protein n=1 Tax=Vaccinium darrowii TaxID=229202 RepID=A0ACB7YF18_9ERIC|nr:hypothetical protein Vadar_021818 [Vaccinium darrowii]
MQTKAENILDFIWSYWEDGLMKWSWKAFRFESLWTTEEKCREIISEEWQKDWEGSSLMKISVTKEKLLEVQELLDAGFNTDLAVTEKDLKRKLEDLWQKDAMFWHQRSRVKWLTLGNKNSRFFHLTTLQRRQRNQIERLKDTHGVWRSERQDLGEINHALTKPIMGEERREGERPREGRRAGLKFTTTISSASWPLATTTTIRLSTSATTTTNSQRLCSFGDRHRYRDLHRTL